MRKSKYNSFDELPLMLTVEDVSHVLGIGLAHAYEVAHRRDFPTITLGSRIIVPRDKFMEWIDEQATKKVRNIVIAISEILWYVFVLKRRDHKWQRNEPTARAASAKSPAAAGRADIPRASTRSPAGPSRKACPPRPRRSAKKSWRKPFGKTGAFPSITRATTP